MKQQALIAVITLASLSAHASAQGPLQQLRQADAASQSALISSSLEQASLTAGAPSDGSQSPVSGSLSVSAEAGKTIALIQGKIQENALSAPPNHTEKAPPIKKPMKLDAWDKVSLGITLGGGLVLPFVLVACGVAGPTAGLIALALIITGVLMGGLFKPKPKSAA